MCERWIARESSPLFVLIGLLLWLGTYERLGCATYFRSGVPFGFVVCNRQGLCLYSVTQWNLHKLRLHCSSARRHRFARYWHKTLTLAVRLRLLPTHAKTIRIALVKPLKEVRSAIVLAETTSCLVVSARTKAILPHIFRYEIKSVFGRAIEGGRGVFADSS